MPPWLEWVLRWLGLLAGQEGEGDESEDGDGMAITVTDRGDATTAASNSVTSGSFTPADGTILVVLVMAARAGATTAPTITVTDSFSDVGSWTAVTNSRVTENTNSPGPAGFAVEQFWALVGSGDSGTITVTHTSGGSPNAMVATFLELGGDIDTADPTGLAANNAATGSETSLGVNLGDTPESGSVLTGVLNTYTDTGTVASPPTSWTETVDSIPGFGIGATTGYINGSGAQTSTWTGLASGAEHRIASVVEWVEAGAAQQDITPAGASVSVTPGTVTVAREEQIAPAGASVTVTPGTVSVALSDQAVSLTGASVSVTPGTLDVGMSIGPGARFTGGWTWESTSFGANGEMGVIGPDLAIHENDATPTDRTADLDLIEIGDIIVISDGSSTQEVTVTGFLSNIGSLRRYNTDPNPSSGWFTDEAAVTLTVESAGITGATISVTPGTLSVELGEQAVSLTGASVSVTPGSVTVAREEQITPAGASVTVTPGTVTVAREEQIAPAGASVSVTPGTLTVTEAQAISVTGASVTVTPGTLSVVREEQIAPVGASVTVTPGTVTIAGDQPVTLTGASVSVTPGTLTIAQGLPISLDGATVTVTPGTVTVAREEQITLTGATVTVTPGTATVAREEQIAPAGASVTVTPGSLTVDLAVALTGASVTVTPGAVTIQGDQPITLNGASVSVTPGAVTVTGDIVAVVTLVEGWQEPQPVAFTEPTTEGWREPSPIEGMSLP